MQMVFVGVGPEGSSDMLRVWVLDGFVMMWVEEAHDGFVMTCWVEEAPSLNNIYFITMLLLMAGQNIARQEN